MCCKRPRLHRGFCRRILLDRLALVGHFIQCNPWDFFCLADFTYLMRTMEQRNMQQRKETEAAPKFCKPIKEIKGK